MIVDCAHYRDGVRQHEGKLSIDEAARLNGDNEGFVWIGLHEPSDEVLGELQERFGLHELAVEDAGQAHQRPKVEEYEDATFVVLKTARYDDEREKVDFGEIHAFIARRYVIAVRHGPASELGPVRRRLEDRPDLLALGPAGVLWAILDKVVDDYQPVVEGLELDLDGVEETIFKGGNATERIYFLRQEVSEFYRAVHPLVAPLDALERGGHPRIPDQLLSYFRDINDHVKRVHEEVVDERDQLTAILQTNMALISTRQNEVMKKVSAWAAIITVPTLIAGIYGMNFRDMPELKWAIGYPLAVSVMLVAAASLYFFFRRIDWL